MYRHCIFCKSALGANERVEHFPVGRRLAFDSARGRLWVICPACSRWNLSPLEERWEAIDECERLFGTTATHNSTENIGLARIRPGLTLVRIGQPLRSEFAAWRYGPLFFKRRQQMIVLTSASAIAPVGFIVAGFAGLVGAGGLILASQLPRIAKGSRATRAIARIRQPDLPTITIRGADTETIVLSANKSGELVVRIKVNNTEHHVEAAEGQRIASLILPHINRHGARRVSIEQAVSTIEYSGGPEHFLAHTARSMMPSSAGTSRRRVLDIPEYERLALEMALHEEQERRALQGELAELEAQWKEAETIASISDDLLLPDRVVSLINALRIR